MALQIVEIYQDGDHYKFSNCSFRVQYGDQIRFKSQGFRVDGIFDPICCANRLNPSGPSFVLNEANDYTKTFNVVHGAHCFGKCNLICDSGPADCGNGTTKSVMPDVDIEIDD